MLVLLFSVMLYIVINDDSFMRNTESFSLILLLSISLLSLIIAMMLTAMDMFKECRDQYNELTIYNKQMKNIVVSKQEIQGRYDSFKKEIDINNFEI